MGRDIASFPETLLPDELHESGIVRRRVDGAVGIHRDAFGRARFRVRIGMRNEARDRAVLRAPDVDAALVAWRGLFARLEVRDIQDVVAVDVKPAGPAELLPLLDETAFGIEDLYA